MGIEASLLDDTTVYAEMNHGRWVVKCLWCAGAELAREDSIFMCSNCGNKEIGHRWVRMEFPKSREVIEQILEKRPLMENRNYSKGESLAKLRRENKEHGVS